MIFTLLLATFLRLFQLGNTSLWFDEAMDLVATPKSFLLLFKSLPLYNISSHFWGNFANTELILRMPSVIFNLISILLIYYFTLQIFNKKTGLISAFLLSISPFHIHYSQEFRMYSLLAMLSLLSVYFLRLSLSRRNNKFWVGYTVFNIMAINVHHIAVSILFTEIIFFLFFWKKYEALRMKWALSNLSIVFFLFLCINPMIMIMKNYSGWWIPLVTWQSILITFKNFSIGYNAAPLLYFSACVLYFPLFCWSIYTARKDKENLLLLCLCIFVPIVIVSLISIILKPFYVDRFLIASSLFYLILVAKGIAELKWKYCSIIVLLSITMITCPALVNYYLDYLPNPEVQHRGIQAKSSTRLVARYIAENFKEGDIICHADENTVPQICYYLSPRYKNIRKPKEAYAQARKGIVMQLNKISGRTEFQLFCATEGPIFKKTDFSLEGNERIWFISSRPLESMENMLGQLRTHYTIVNVGETLKGIKNINFLKLEGKYFNK